MKPAIVSVASLFAVTSTLAFGEEGGTQFNAKELAQELANPVSSLISTPFQLNFDENIGPLDEGSRLSLNIQPVVPITLNDDWNLISRTIVPVVKQTDIFPGSGSQSGLGDTVQSFFFSFHISEKPRIASYILLNLFSKTLQNIFLLNLVSTRLIHFTDLHGNQDTHNDEEDLP